MKIIISGVAGFIGSHLAKRFIAEGHEVVGLDNLSNGKISNVPPQVDFFQVDLESTAFIDKIPKGCQMILHLAGQSSGEISYHDPVGDLKKNTISTLNLINYGIENNIRKFLYASSMSVYGEIECPPQGVKEEEFTNPISCYGIGKLASEKYLEIYKNKLPYVSLRMFNVYGPGQDMENMKQGMVSIYLSQAIKSNNILVKGSLSRFRDFIYIDDVIETWFRASIYENVFNQKINIGTGKKTTVKELTDIIKNITKTKEINVISETPCDQLGIFSNSDKLSKLLKYQPQFSLNKGLDMFYKWARCQ